MLLRLLRDRNRSAEDPVPWGSVAHALAESAPREIFDLALASEDDDTAPWLASAACGFALIQPEAGIAATDRIRDPILKAIFLSDLFSRWEMLAPAALDAWLESRPDRERFASALPQNLLGSRISFSTPETGVRAMNARPAIRVAPDERIRQAEHLVGLSGVGAEFETLASRLADQGWRDAVLCAAAVKLAETDLVRASRTLSGIRTPEARSRAASTIAAWMALRDADEALRFAATLPSPRERILANATAWSVLQPQMVEAAPPASKVSPPRPVP